MEYIKRFLLSLLFFSLPVLAAPKDITITANEWPPYTSAHIEEGGLVIELVTAAFAEEDIRVRYKIMPWARAINSVEAAESDVIAAWYSDDRDKKFRFSQSFLTNKMVFVKRMGEDIYWQTLNDLKEYTFVLLRGAVNQADFDNATEFNKTYVTEEDTAVDLVIKGRADLTVRDQGTVEYLIKSKPDRFADKVDFVEKALSNSPLHLIASKQHRDGALIIEIFNRGLATIKQNGTYQKLLNKYGSTLPE